VAAMSVNFNRLVREFESSLAKMESSLPGAVDKDEKAHLMQLQERLQRIHGLIGDTINKPTRVEKSGKDEKDKNLDKPEKPEPSQSFTPALVKATKPIDQASGDILDKAGCTYTKDMYWYEFNFNPTADAQKDQRASGYEDAKNQWQLFLNPKKAYLPAVMEAVFAIAKANGIQLQGRINRQDRLKVGLNNSCDPKFVLYFKDDTAKERLKSFIEAIETTFDRDQIDEISCDQGKKELWVENEAVPSQFVRKEVSHWGPAYTKMRSKLIFYSQGGLAEREKFAKMNYDAEGMKAHFEGDNSYRFKGETDPIGDAKPVVTLSVMPPRGYLANWLLEKMKSLPKEQITPFFMKCIKPVFSKDNCGYLMSLFELFVNQKLEEDFSFLQKLKTDCSSDDVEKLLMGSKFEDKQWILRYSKTEDQWVVARKEEKIDGFEVSQYLVGKDDLQSILRELNTAGFKNLVTPFLNNVVPTAPQFEPPFNPDAMQKIFLLSQLESLDTASTIALLQTVFLQSSSSSAASSQKSANVEGTRSTELPKDAQFLEKAIERIVKWTADQTKTIDSAQKTAATLPQAQKERREKEIQAMQERARQASATRLYEIAKAKLQKSVVTDAEVSVVTGKSIANLRAMKIQEAYKKTQGFDFAKIADELGITQAVLKEWLVDSEKEVWLNSVLMEIGGKYTEKASQIPLASLHPYLVDLNVFFDEFERNIQNFTKPLQILKMHNVKANLDLLLPVPFVDLEPFKKRCDALIEQMIDGLKRTRQASLVSLGQSPSTPQALRNLISVKLFSLAMTIQHPFTGASQLALARARAINPQEQIEEIRRLAQETISIIDEILLDISKYDSKKAKLPESIVSFCDNNKHDLKSALAVIQKKLQNIITRQGRRQQLVELGIGFEPPVFFHATPQLDTAFAIVTTAIRPAHARSFYGAFTSTSPAMLMYGDAIVGAPQTAAFTGDIGQAPSHMPPPSWHHWPKPGPLQPLFMPDKRSNMNLGVFHHKTKEKWIGLQDPIGMNPRIQEMKNQFYQTLFSSLHEYYSEFCKKAKAAENEKEYAQFEAELLASLEKKHLLFSFTENPQDKSKGVWTVVIEDILTFQNGQYVNFSSAQLAGHLKPIKVLPRFQSHLFEHVKEFLPQVEKSLLAMYVPAAASSGSSSSAPSNNLSWLDRLLPRASSASGSSQPEKAFEVPGGRGLSTSPYIIAIDEEPIVSKYFLNPMIWPSARHGNKVHKQDDIKTQYSRALGTDSGAGSGSTPAKEAQELAAKQKRITDLFVDTHVLPLMEQLIEWDFTTREGVRVLTSWVS
jgi:hypothetical protein